MPRSRVKVLPVALAGLLAVGAPAGVMAANGDTGVPGQRFAREELTAFAVARSELIALEREYSAKIRSAVDAHEALKLRAEARRKMRAAVVGAGLTLGAFKRIARAAREDPEMQRRIEQLAE